MQILSLYYKSSYFLVKSGAKKSRFWRKLKQSINEYTLYYLLREQDRLTILKFFYHPEHTKSTLFA